MDIFGKRKPAAALVLEAFILPTTVLSQKEIALQTGLSIRSVKSALHVLVQRGAIDEQCSFGDLRLKRYVLSGDVHA